jgi:hypothetical protein
MLVVSFLPRAALAVMIGLMAFPAAAQDQPAEAASPAAASPEAPSPPAADDAQELAKKLSNPIASLISVPFQENIDFGAGPDCAQLEHDRAHDSAGHLPGRDFAFWRGSVRAR